MLHIDRATDLLVAVCYGPSHAGLGEKDGQHAAQPYVFIGLAMTVFARAKPRQSAVQMGDGADPEQGGDRREAIQDAALCSAILGSIISRRWARPSGCCSPRHRYGRACGTIERAAEREAASRALPVTWESTNVQCRRDHRKRPLLVRVTFRSNGPPTGKQTESHRFAREELTSDGRIRGRRPRIELPVTGASSRPFGRRHRQQQVQRSAHYPPPSLADDAR
jgi:hypothetical protein